VAEERVIWLGAGTRQDIEDALKAAGFKVMTDGKLGAGQWGRQGKFTEAETTRVRTIVEDKRTRYASEWFEEFLSGCPKGGDHEWSVVAFDTLQKEAPTVEPERILELEMACGRCQYRTIVRRS
jgi:hypothetical protein